MQCMQCPEGYICTVEKALSWGEVAGTVALVVSIVALVIAGIVGLVHLLDWF